MTSELGRYDDATYYLIVMTSLLTPFERAPGHRYFRLVVFLDESQIQDSETLGQFALNALRAGARSVLCGGSAAERVHDMFDATLVWENEMVRRLYNLDQGEFIPTTWHTDESPVHVLWNAYSLGFGCDAFEEDNPAIFVVVLQDDPRIAALQEIGTDLQRSLDAASRED